MNWLEKIIHNAELVAPPGVNLAAVAEKVANQIAMTIIHEAAHGKRWAMDYYTNKLSLKQMDRSTEEMIAEDAERAANLSTDLDGSIFDDSTDAESMSNSELLNRAITIANGRTNFFIPVNSVKDEKLSPEAQGQFEMIQTGQQPKMQVSEYNPAIAWDAEDRKLKVDVDKIVSNYNKALGGGTKKPTMPSTYQQDGTTPDFPGVSKAPPTAPNTVPTTPARPVAPTWEAR